MIQKNKFATVYVVNLVDEKGNPSWPERYTREDTDRVREMTDPFTFEREYMNNPIEEGRKFPLEYIRFKKPLPFNQYKVIIGMWDFSYTTMGNSKSFALIGAAFRELHVLDVFCRKTETTAAIDFHYQNAKRWRKLGITPFYYYDASVAQEEIWGPLLGEKAIQHQSYDIPMPDKSTVDKFLRIDATLTSAFFNKLLFFADYLKDSPDFIAAKNQILAFEKGSKADDDFPDVLEIVVRKAQEYSFYDEGSTAFNKPIIKPHIRKGY